MCVCVIRKGYAVRGQNVLKLKQSQAARIPAANLQQKYAKVTQFYMCDVDEDKRKPRTS